MYMRRTAELLFVRFSRFVSLYFSITYVFSIGVNSSTPPASTIFPLVDLPSRQLGDWERRGLLYGAKRHDASVESDARDPGANSLRTFERRRCAGSSHERLTRCAAAVAVGILAELLPLNGD